MGVSDTFLQDIECLKTIKYSCQTRKESILEYYCDCMLKIRRAYYKAEQTELLLYIRQIMKAAFPLIIHYFKCCVDNYHNETDYNTRAEILTDIENSVVEFDEMFDTIIHATNNVDRMLFQTAPITTATHCTAPKLCAFYSEMMNRLAAILMDKELEEMEYGFCVYPTLNSGATAKILFSTTNNAGNVVIIRIPAKSIADISQMRVYLFHELFHVIPGETIRRRKARAEVFLQQLMYNVRENTFLNCDYSFLKVAQKKGIFESEQTLEERITRELFEGVAKKVQAEIDKDNLKAYYSDNMETICQNAFSKDFSDILKDEKLFETILKQYSVSEQSYKNYAEVYSGVLKLCQCVTANYYKCISANIFSESCDFYMSIFREIFADMMMITTLRLSQEKYLDALRSIEQANLYEELFTVVRLFVVSRVMKSLPAGLLESVWEIPDDWEVYINDLARRKEMGTDKANRIRLLATDSQWAGGISVNQVILDLYVDFLKKSALAYEDLKKSHEKKYKEFANAFLCSDDIAIQRICCRNWQL